MSKMMNAISSLFMQYSTSIYNNKKTKIIFLNKDTVKKYIKDLKNLVNQQNHFQ